MFRKRKEKRGQRNNVVRRGEEGKIGEETREPLLFFHVWGSFPHTIDGYLRSLMVLELFCLSHLLLQLNRTGEPICPSTEFSPMLREWINQVSLRHGAVIEYVAFFEGFGDLESKCYIIN